MDDVAIIDTAEAATALLGPLRARVLAALTEPGSASSVAELLGAPRQKVNYHLRTLEAAGLVSFVAERPRRGLTERVFTASARSYVVSPAVLGPNAPDPRRTDRLSSAYLLAVASRLLADVADLVRRADQARRPLATLTLDTELRFASAADRAAFTRELTETVHRLVATYHDDGAPDGRWHRLVIAAHPVPDGTPPEKEPAP